MHNELCKKEKGSVGVEVHFAAFGFSAHYMGLGNVVSALCGLLGSNVY
jgi:hypothetical protein